jgi:hypothetical protein
MLAAQMAAVHVASMTLAQRLGGVEDVVQQDSAERAFNKLTRTFAMQMEALKRYRAGAEQKVTLQSLDAAGEFYYTLRGNSPPKKQRAAKGQPKPPKVPTKQDPRVIAAAALTRADAPDGWVAELLKAGFAITHDKTTASSSPEAIISVTRPHITMTRIW